MPGEDVGNVSSAGVVQILYGSPAGLTATGNQLWHQDSPGIEDNCDPFDGFGKALAARDFNGDGYYDLAVGVPSESIGNVERAGAVNIIYGSQAGQ